MSLILYATNLLEAATLTASVPADLPLARLADRDAAEPFMPAFQAAWRMSQVAPLTLAMGPPVPVQFDIDADLGVTPAPASHWVMAHRNMAGVTVTVYAAATYPPATQRDQVVAPGGMFQRAFGAGDLTFRYWRWRVAAMAVPSELPELFLTKPEIMRGPTVKVSSRATVGNVARDWTPAHIPYTTRRGGPRVRLDYAWNAVEAASDDAAIERAYAACDEGNKGLFVEDPFGVLRWMHITVEELVSEYVNSRLRTKRLTLEEVPPEDPAA